MRGGAGDGPSMVTAPASASLNVSTLLAERIADESIWRLYGLEISIWGSSYPNLVFGFVRIRVKYDNLINEFSSWDYPLRGFAIRCETFRAKGPL